MSGPAISLLRRHPLVAYVALAYLVTWALLLPLALAARGVVAPRLPTEWHTLGAVGPFTAALIVTWACGGWPAVRAWLGRLGRWRVGARWWLLAAGSPVALLALAAVLVHLAGAPWPDLARLRLPVYANPRWLADLLLVATLAYALGEEPGWRGFALPRLEARHGPLRATLILTALWALWHWPAFLYRPAYQGGLPTVVGFLLGLLAGAVVLTFLYDGTGGSLLLVVVWHALINVAMQVAAIVSPPALAALNLLVAAGATAIAVWWIARARHRHAPPPAEPATDPSPGTGARDVPALVPRRSGIV